MEKPPKLFAVLLPLLIVSLQLGNLIDVNGEEQLIDEKSIFQYKVDDVKAKLTPNPIIPLTFELERDFAKESGDEDISYQLFKVIDAKTNKRIGDLRIYLGSVDWWNNNAFLQLDDTSGFDKILLVKMLIVHYNDPNTSKEVTDTLQVSLKQLVPEWSSETSDTSLEDWFYGTMSNAPRNEEKMREDSIMIANKEVRALNDDLGFGSTQIIVTDNFDETKQEYVNKIQSAEKISTELKTQDELKVEKIEQKPIVEAEPIIQQESNGGGCLIATATYGSELVPQVQFLREIRDNTVMSTQSGTSFMSAFNTFYYSFSPTVADWERQNPMFKETVKLTITPLLSSLSLLQFVDIDTEEEMLGYGIGIILLNIGMYFVAPVAILLKIKDHRKAKFGSKYMIKPKE